MKQPVFRFGEWTVEVAGNALSQGDVRIPLEPRAMDVLRYLCRHPGAVIPAEEILQACWGTAELGDNPIHKAIAQLRRALGDSSTEPRYIETVRKRGYRALADVVEEEEQAGIWQDGSPFRGLEAFEESHAAIFFGRMQATTRLRETVLSQVENGCAMALVLGPSGSGKTSLVRAGLLPQLSGGDGPVALSCLLHMDCADLGGGDLFGALAAVLVDAEWDGVHLFDGSSAETLAGRLRSEPASVAAQFSAGEGPVRIAVFVDRLEAIFRAPNTSDTDRARFIGLLDVLATHRVLVMLACRNDFYPELIALPELMALKTRGGHFDLEPPDGADIAQMVRLPARAAGLTFEIDPATGASLDDVLCDEARGSPDALPLLQYCLNELYRQRSEDGVLRFEVFRQLGGIEGALGVRAEQIFAGLPGEQQAALPHVLSLLVSVGEEQNAVTARRATWSALRSTGTHKLVAALVETRLFVSDLIGDIASFGVAHEALLRRWPRVRSWIERHRELLQIKTRVALQALRWRQAGCSRDLLLPAGVQTEQATVLLNQELVSLSADERDYIFRSAQRARMARMARFLLTGLIGLLGLVAIIMGLKAKSAQMEAERKTGEAEALMSFMLGNFVDKLRPLGRLELLDSVSERALVYLSEASNVNPVTQRQRASNLQLIAEVSRSRGRPSTAQEALTKAETILNGLLENHPNDPLILKEFGVNSFWQGQIALDRKDWSAAVRMFEKYKMFAQRLLDRDPEQIDAIRELSYAYNSLGSAHQRKGALSIATPLFVESAKLKSHAMALAPQDDSLAADYANSLSWLGKVETELGNLRQAAAYYEKERLLLEPLHHRTPSNANYARRLAFNLAAASELKLALGDLAGARIGYQSARKLMEALADIDRTNNNWRIYSAILKQSESSLQDGSARENDLDQLRENLTLALSLKSGQGLRSDVSQLISVSYLALARAHIRRKEYLASGFNVTKATEALNAKDQGTGDASADLRIITEIDLVTSELAIAKGEKSAARNICEAIQTRLTPSIATTKDYRILDLFVRSHVCTGTRNQANKEIKILNAIGYHHPRYVEYLLNHPDP